MHFKKIKLILLLFIVFSSNVNAQSTHMDSLEILNAVMLNGTDVKKSKIPNFILKFLKNKTGKKFTFIDSKTISALIYPEKYGRYFLYSVCISKYFVLTYMSIGYSSNTHVLVFRTDGKKVISEANLITVDHKSITELQNLMKLKDFRFVFSQNY